MENLLLQGIILCLSITTLYILVQIIRHIFNFLLEILLSFIELDKEDKLKLLAVIIVLIIVFAIYCPMEPNLNDMATNSVEEVFNRIEALDLH